jgi:hypothetical protein
MQERVSEAAMGWSSAKFVHGLGLGRSRPSRRVWLEWDGRCGSFSVGPRCVSGWWRSGGLLVTQDDGGGNGGDDIGFGEYRDDSEAASAWASQDVYEEHSLE